MKSLRPHLSGDPDLLERFVREARLQAQIEHPAVVPVYEMSTAPDGTTFFVMRRIRGLTLRQVLAQLSRRDLLTQVRFSRRKLLTALSQLCLAVHFAHSRGVLHRDLKPENVMLGDFGEVYLLDWGIARIPGGLDPVREGVPERADLTGNGTQLGTPLYMSPEQVAGLAEDIDHRTDVFSLGIVLFEILTLQKRHSFAKMEDIFASTRRGDVFRPSERADVPPELDDICVKATAHRREDRFGSAKELAEAIDRYLDGEVDAGARQRLVERHIQVAETLLREAKPGDAAPRARAMQEVLRALALNPDQADTRQALFRLLTEAPTELAPEAEAELAARNHRALLQGLRMGRPHAIIWMVCCLFGVLMGVRDWRLFAPGALLLGASAALLQWMIMREDTSRRSYRTLIVISFGLMASLSVWLGPFVLVPVAACCLAMIYAAQLGPEDRRFMTAAALLITAIPFVLELLQVLPPGVEFRDGAIVLFARALDIHPAWTVPALIYSSLSFVVAATYYIGQLRDSLARAERTLFTQAWHFQQLIGTNVAAVRPPAPPSSAAPWESGPTSNVR